MPVYLPSATTMRTATTRKSAIALTACVVPLARIARARPVHFAWHDVIDLSVPARRAAPATRTHAAAPNVMSAPSAQAIRSARRRWRA